MATASKKQVIVVGGGLAGLACTIRLAEEGVDVDLFSMIPVRRSHSVCAQGGINACNEIARQQGYSEWMHYDENKFVANLFYDEQPADDAVRIVDCARKTFARVLRKLPDAALARTGTHNERGRITVASYLQAVVDHLEHHVKFIHDKRAYMGKEMW